MRRAGGAWLCALSLLACTESTTRTQITLVVRAAPAVQRDAATVTIAFRTGNSRDALEDSDASERFGDDSDPGSIAWPISLALLRESDASVFEVQIEARDAEGDVIARRVVQSGFAPRKTKLLEVWLERLSAECVAAECGPSENCSEQGGVATCEDPPFLDPDDLPDVMEGDAGPGDACEGDDAPDCGEHGRCVMDGDEPACECDAGYAGEACDRCADSHVLVDGACAELCGPADMADCEPGEICTLDADGEPSCAAVCDGDLLPNAAGDCVPICESVIAPDCGEHGSCSGAREPPICVCDDGYIGAECDACAEGYGDDGSGECVELCSAAIAPDCGAHGTCTVTGDSASCACTFPYAGTLCDECAEGYAKNGDVCEPDCGACGVHEFCNPVPTVPACACVIGYDSGDPLMCTWEGGGTNGGGLVDESFGDEAAWSTRLASFDPDFFAAGDGLIAFERLGLCGDSTIAQSFDMPAASDAEPLVFAIEYFSNADNFECDSAAALVVGGVPQPIPMAGGQNGTARVCLGANAFGPGVELELKAITEIGCPTSINCTPRSFGGVSIEPALPGECGLPGEFGNVDFAANGVQGWNFIGFQGQSVDPAGAMVLQSRTGCTTPYAENSVSVPLPSELENPAITFVARVDPGARAASIIYSPYVDLGIDDVVIKRTPLAMGVETTVTTCLPSHTAGSSRVLRFSGFYATNTCWPDDGTSLYDLSLRDIALVSDPDCASGAPDLALDIPAAKTPWQLAVASYFNDPNMVYIDETPGVAHSGDRAIAIETGTGTACVQNSASTRALVPEPDGERRPVLRFWHRIDTTGGPTYSSSPFGGAFTPAADWAQREVCIDSSFGGELVTLQFQAGCNNNGVLHRLWIDDVEMSTCANPGPCAAGACP